jgi:hypothetical protein
MPDQSPFLPRSLPLREIAEHVAQHFLNPVGSLPFRRDLRATARDQLRFQVLSGTRDEVKSPSVRELVGDSFGPTKQIGMRFLGCTDGAVNFECHGGSINPTSFSYRIGGSGFRTI